MCEHIVSKTRTGDPAGVPKISAHVVPQSADRVALRDQGREKGGMDRREKLRM